MPPSRGGTHPKGRTGEAAIAKPGEVSHGRGGRHTQTDRSINRSLPCFQQHGQEAMEAGVAPKVVLAATHRKALEVCALSDLVAHAVDAPPPTAAEVRGSGGDVERGGWVSDVWSGSGESVGAGCVIIDRTGPVRLHMLIFFRGRRALGAVERRSFDRRWTTETADETGKRKRGFALCASHAHMSKQARLGLKVPRGEKSPKHGNSKKKKKSHTRQGFFSCVLLNFANCRPFRRNLLPSLGWSATAIA